MELNLGKCFKIARLGLAGLVMSSALSVTAMAEEVTVVIEEKEVVVVKTAENFIVMYDRSSSMGDMYMDTGMKEIDAELKILKEKNATLPPLNWQAGLYSFTPGLGANDPFVTYQPMQTYNQGAFGKAIDGLPAKARGVTLLQQGLLSLDPILKKLNGRTVVFLFTDGQYTPTAGLAKPGAIAKQLAEKYDVCFYVIDTDDSKKYDEAIKAVASASDCGKVLMFSQLLGHPEWMTDALFIVKEMTAEVVMVKDKVMGKIFNAALFNFDKADLTADAIVKVNELGILLQENAQAKVILAGYTDNVGTKEYNTKLSQSRADSVRKYLVEKMGIDPNRITLNWFGFDDPAASNDTEEGRAMNRRVTSVIMGM